MEYKECEKQSKGADLGLTTGADPKKQSYQQKLQQALSSVRSANNDTYDLLAVLTEVPVEDREKQVDSSVPCLISALDTIPDEIEALSSGTRKLIMEITVLLRL